MHTLPEITAETINSWLEKSVQEIAEVMFSTGAFPTEAPSAETNEGELVVACIGTRGEFKLEVSFFFPLTLATHFATLSFELPPEELKNKMIKDVVGEFSNMVVGTIKSRASDMQFACTMTVPQTFREEANSPDFQKKVTAALAVVRGSAGPRNPATSTHSVLYFSFGNEVVRVESHY